MYFTDSFSFCDNALYAYIKYFIYNAKRKTHLLELRIHCDQRSG